MKLFLVTLLLSVNVFAGPTVLCEAQICNRIKRFSLDPFKHLGDRMGENCFTVTMPKEEAVVGKEINSESRWYQGSFNPTKRSVTYVKSVGACH